MFTSKQRSNLRSIAQNIDAITQIGKGGLSDNSYKALSDALNARELIKISVLNNCDVSAKELADCIESSFRRKLSPSSVAKSLCIAEASATT